MKTKLRKKATLWDNDHRIGCIRIRNVHLTIKDNAIIKLINIKSEQCKMLLEIDIPEIPNEVKLHEQCLLKA